MLLNIRLWAVVAGCALLLMMALGVALPLFLPRVAADPASYPKTVLAVKSLFFLLTLVLAYAMAPVLVGGFLWAQLKIGNAEQFLVAFVLRHQAAVVLAFWGIWTLGLLIASPYLVRELLHGKR